METFPPNASLHFLSFLLSSLQMDLILRPNPAFVYLAFVFFASLANHSFSLDEKFQACAPSSCGQGPSISYPFRLSHRQQSFCGYPNFDLSCNDDNYPVLKISYDDYIIKDIFYSNQSFLVARASAYDEEDDTCPAPLHNVTLDRTPFNISPGYLNFSFLYNCTSKPAPKLIYPIDCAPGNDSLVSFAGFHTELLKHWYNYSLDSCHYLVNAPLHDYGDGASDDRLFTMNYTEILKMGFLLNWTAHNCSTCEGSGGRCGFENNEFVCFCQHKPHSLSCDDDNSSSGHSKGSLYLGVGGGIASGVVAISVISCIAIYYFKKKSSWKINKNSKHLEEFLKSHGPLPVNRYSFSQIKKITYHFKDKLGQGGYGSVYKGKLFDGRFVAVKILNTSKGEGQEFINEVASISRTSHVNIVTLLGFCLEGEKRVLVYEFMANGSLDKFLYHESSINNLLDRHLEWKIMHQIAIGIARGLEYLHGGCNTMIIHFDIKPHNILLDENFYPKISDFGLAKLSTRKESVVSMSEARGTIGYIAPEIFNRNFGKVSDKSDVYSYGMMVLEMIGGKKKDDNDMDHVTSEYFPNWIYRRVELDNDTSEWYGKISVEENEMVRKMTMVGLWCIQTNPSDRPSMSRVIEMLEGSIEALQIPPNPFLSSPPRPPTACSFTMSIET